MINVTNKPEVLLQDRLERIKKFVQDATDSYLVGGEDFTSDKLEITFVGNGTFVIEKKAYEWEATIYGCSSIKDELYEFLKEFKEEYRSAGFRVFSFRWVEQEERSNKLFNLVVYPL